MIRCISHILLLQLLAFLIPVSIVLARTDRPIKVTLEQIERLPVIGRLNPTTISIISDFQIIDIDNNSFDEIVCNYKDRTEISTFSGQKLRIMSFPFPIYGWSALDVEDLGGCCIFIFREVDNCIRMDVFNMDKELIVSLNLCKVSDLNESGDLDINIDVYDLADINKDDKKELILQMNSGYDLYPRGLLIIDIQHWRIIRNIPTAGGIRYIHCTDLDMDKNPDILLATYSSSNGAVVGDWNDSQSALIGIRGYDGSVLWRRVVGGPFSLVQPCLIDLDGDGREEILAAEHSMYAKKERNTRLIVFSLPDAVKVSEWECPSRKTLINCFTAWGQGEKSKILVGFNNGDLVVFDRNLNPSPLYHFHEPLSFIHDIDLNSDGQKEVLVGFDDGTVAVLDEELRLVGRQSFTGLPIPVRTSEDEFGEFVVISEGRVWGWSVAGVEFHPPPPKLMAWLRQWALFIGILAVVALVGVLLMIHGRRRFNLLADGKTTGIPAARISDFAKLVLVDAGQENIHKAICSEIISQQKAGESYDYLIFLLGDVRIYTGAGETLIAHRHGLKWKVICCYLVANRTHQIHRDNLIDLFWRDSNPKQATQNLHSTIHRLNQELSIAGKGRFVVFSEQCYSINSEYRIFTDVLKFECLITQSIHKMNDNRFDEAIEHYLMAIRLYTGDYMTNLYESWCDVDRENIRNLYLNALKQVGRYLLKENEPDMAVGYFRNALKIDEYSEELYVDIMRCHAASGNKKAIEREYQRLQTLLRAELSSNPRDETTRIYRSLIS